MTRVVVTGSSGFVGGRLVRGLLAAGDVGVTAVVRQPVAWLPRSIQRAVDLGSSRAARSLFEGADAVIHLAGPNEVAMDRSPNALSDAFAMGRAVADGCVHANVRRVIFVSTVQVYGAALVPGATVDETRQPEPRSAYALARLGTEHLLARTADNGVDVVVFRLTNSVGAPADVRVDRWTLVVNDLCRQAVVTGQIRLRSAGLQWRDFVALDDVCAVVGVAMFPGSLPSGTYNLGSGASTTILGVAGLVQAAARRAGLGEIPVHAPTASASPPAAYRVDVARLRGAGCWPVTPIETAIDQVMEFCVENRSLLHGRTPPGS